ASAMIAPRLPGQRKRLLANPFSRSSYLSRAYWSPGATYPGLTSSHFLDSLSVPGLHLGRTRGRVQARISCVISMSDKRAVVTPSSATGLSYPATFLLLLQAGLPALLR